MSERHFYIILVFITISFIGLLACSMSNEDIPIEESRFANLQTQNQSLQTADIEVKFGAAQIKNIVLAAPKQKTGSNISVKLDGVEQAIENSKQDGNTITISLKSACEVNAGSTLKVSFNLDKNNI